MVSAYRSAHRRLLAPKPTVALVNGHAIAGGLVLALACDHRFTVTGDHRIGANEVAIGAAYPAAAIEIVHLRLTHPVAAQLVLGRSARLERRRPPRHRRGDRGAGPRLIGRAGTHGSSVPSARSTPTPRPWSRRRWIASTRRPWTRRWRPPPSGPPTRAGPHGPPSAGRRLAGKPCEELVLGEGARGAPPSPPSLVTRTSSSLIGRDAVRASQQHDLPVEVVGPDRSRPPGEALPRGAARTLLAADRPRGGHPSAARSSSRSTKSMPAARSRPRPPGAPDHRARRGAPRDRQGLDGVAEVREQLAPLPASNVIEGPRANVEAPGAAASWSTTSPRPRGQRPMSRIPVMGLA